MNMVACRSKVHKWVQASETNRTVTLETPEGGNIADQHNHDHGRGDSEFADGRHAELCDDNVDSNLTTQRGSQQSLTVNTIFKLRIFDANVFDDIVTLNKMMLVFERKRSWLLSLIDRA